MVLLALLPLEWLVVPFLADPTETSEIEVGPAPSGAAELALLKLQAQVVIASDRLDRKAAREALDNLSRTAVGDRAVAGLALLEAFLEPDSGRGERLIGRLAGESTGDLVGLTRKAVQHGLEEDEREKLRDSMGWFADLARGPGLAAPPDDGLIRSRSTIFLGLLGLGLLLVCACLLVGAVLLILQLRRLKLGAARAAFVPEPTSGAVLLECFALYLGIMTAGAVAGTLEGPHFSVVGTVAAVGVPLLWPRLRGMRWREFRRVTGLHRGQGWAREVGAGIAGYLAVMAIASIGVAVSLGLTLLFESIRKWGWFPTRPELGGGGEVLPAGPQSHPIVGWIYEGDVWQRLFCLFLAAGFAPFFEELFFRGALHGALRSRHRFVVAALGSGLIFAALHPQGVLAIPALGAMGFGFSMLREWRGSLVAPMTAHAINNGVLVLMLWALL